MVDTIDFTTWEPGRVVFREQDGVIVHCPKCGRPGARIRYLKGIVHIGSWEPYKPGRYGLTYRLVKEEGCDG